MGYGRGVRAQLRRGHGERGEAPGGRGRGLRGERRRAVKREKLALVKGEVRVLHAMAKAMGEADMEVHEGQVGGPGKHSYCIRMIMTGLAKTFSVPT